MTNNLLEQATHLMDQVRANLIWVLYGIGLLWGFSFLNWIFRSKLNQLGIYPRRLGGLIGLIFSPFLHGNFNHLFFNSVALFFLINMVLLSGKLFFIWLTLWIMFAGGLAVWFMGRSAYHIGASTLIMGYWGYLIVNAFYHGTLLAIVLGLVSLYYFGGLFLSLLPTDRGTSWESHLCGAAAGVAANYVWPSMLPFISAWHIHLP